jgi:hypothetical protein
MGALGDKLRAAQTVGLDSVIFIYYLLLPLSLVLACFSPTMIGFAK